MKATNISAHFTAPAFTIEHTDGSYEVFDGFDDLYETLHNRKDSFLGTVMGYAEFILLLGDVPIKYVEKEKKFYTLGWTEFSPRIEMDDKKKEVKS